MSIEQWTAVDAYFEGLFIPPDADLQGALERSDAAGLPQIAVAPNQGKLLMLLAQMSGAKRILEVGTLAGYSTIWLARALPPDGKLITIEFDAHHAEIARQNIAAAGLAEQVEVRQGEAVQVLADIHAENPPPFDFVFLDADKHNFPNYLDWSIKLGRAGTVIVGDNVVRNGAVADPTSDDPNVQGVQEFCRKMADDPRIEATALQTVGAKGYDGFAMGIIVAE